MAASPSELILDFFRNGIYQFNDPEILTKLSGFEQTDVATAISLFETELSSHASRSVGELILPSLSIRTDYSNSNLSSPSDSPPRKKTHMGAEDDPIDLPPNSPSPSSTIAFASPLSKELGYSSVPQSPVLRLHSEVREGARRSLDAIERLQQETYARRINELFEFVTHKTINPKSQWYLEKFREYCKQVRPTSSAT